ncbi:serine protease [Salinispirillum marinum]|uniref:Serine protease n=2 Tax=Saccharospirillaceae TaxID=255527 RepID=A0ABV8BIF9_9GAMM
MQQWIRFIILSIFLSGSAAAFSLEPRIVGGDEVAGSSEEDAFSYTVGVFSSGGVCGGSYIGNRMILTAAHCVEDSTSVTVRFSETGSMFVTAGDSVFYANDTVVIKVSDWYIHPDYRASSYDNDVAVLVLSENPPGFARSIALASKPQTDSIISNRLTMTAYGWGLTREDGDLADELQFVELGADSMEYCRSRYGESTITNKMICAGGSSLLDQGQDTCQGDSGGPLVYVEGGTPYIVGITSFGSGCAELGIPGVYARVSAFIDWINAMTPSSVPVYQQVVGPRSGEPFHGAMGPGWLVVLLALFFWGRRVRSGSLQ